MEIQSAPVLARDPPSPDRADWLVCCDARVVGLDGDGSGAGKNMTAIRLSFSRVSVRWSTERRHQPSASSPTWSLIELLVTSFRTSAISRGLPITVPCSVRGGRSSSACGEDPAIGAGGGGGGGGGGGRRDVEKSGRSRVTKRELRGIRRRGFPCGEGCCKSRFSALMRRGPAVGPVSEPLAPRTSWPLAAQAAK